MSAKSALELCQKWSITGLGLEQNWTKTELEPGLKLDLIWTTTGVKQTNQNYGVDDQRKARGLAGTKMIIKMHLN